MRTQDRGSRGAGGHLEGVSRVSDGRCPAGPDVDREHGTRGTDEGVLMHAHLRHQLQHVTRLCHRR